MNAIPTNKGSTYNYLSWCFSFKRLLLIPITASALIGLILNRAVYLEQRQLPRGSSSTMLWHDISTYWYNYLAGGSPFTVILAQLGGKEYREYFHDFFRLLVALHVATRFDTTSIILFSTYSVRFLLMQCLPFCCSCIVIFDFVIYRIRVPGNSYFMITLL
jgi:hypothetical protein